MIFCIWISDRESFSWLALSTSLAHALPPSCVARGARVTNLSRPPSPDVGEGEGGTLPRGGAVWSGVEVLVGAAAMPMRVSTESGSEISWCTGASSTHKPACGHAVVMRDERLLE